MSESEENESGRERYQVVRAPPNGSKKKFWQPRSDGVGGWINNLQGVGRLPYRLPDLLAYEDARVLIPEGEKDVDTLFGIGLVATCKFRECRQVACKGTRLGRQELNAEILDDVPGALWSRSQHLGLRDGAGSIAISSTRCSPAQG